MIILRYLTREILFTTVAFSFCASLLFFGNRFTQYLDQAADGELTLTAILMIVVYRIPDIMVLILPVTYFLSILIAYGRLYSDNEMVVLSSGGVSQARLLSNTMLSAAIMASIVGTVSLFVMPYTINKVEEIKLQQENRGLFDLLIPGQFAQFDNDSPTTYYFETFSQNGNIINQVFVADMDVDPNREGVSSLVWAEAAQEFVDSPTGNRYLQLNNGRQYVGKPGELDYQVNEFRHTGRLLEQGEDEPIFRKYFERQTTAALFRFNSSSARNNARAQGELQWRFSFPLLVFILTIIAVPLSYTNPRSGRFAKIFPALLLTFFYYGLLLVAQRNLEEQKVSPYVGVWWVHALFLTIGLSLLFWNNGRPRGKWIKPAEGKPVQNINPEVGQGGKN